MLFHVILNLGIMANSNTIFSVFCESQAQYVVLNV